MRFRSFELFLEAVVIWLGLIQQKSVVAQLALLQVKMGPFQSCSSWQPTTRDSIRIFVMQQLSQGVRTRCNCNFNESHFITPNLRCGPVLNHPTFRAAVVDVVSSSGVVVSSRALVQHAEDWVKSSPLIVSGLAVITVDSSCPINPNSFDDQACSDSPGITVTGLVGALIVEFIVLSIIGFIAFAIFVTVVTSRKKMQQQSKEQRKYKVTNKQQHQNTSPPRRLETLPLEIIPRTDVHTHPCPAYSASYNSST